MQMSYMQMNKEVWLLHADELHADEQGVVVVTCRIGGRFSYGSRLCEEASSYHKHPAVRKLC